MDHEDSPDVTPLDLVVVVHCTTNQMYEFYLRHATIPDSVHVVLLRPTNADTTEPGQSLPELNQPVAAPHTTTWTEFVTQIASSWFGGNRPVNMDLDEESGRGPVETETYNKSWYGTRLAESVSRAITVVYVDPDLPVTATNAMRRALYVIHSTPIYYVWIGETFLEDFSQLFVTIQGYVPSHGETAVLTLTQDAIAASVGDTAVHTVNWLRPDETDPQGRPVKRVMEAVWSTPAGVWALPASLLYPLFT